MKILKIIGITLLAGCFTACSGGNGSIKPVAKKINGPLGNFFEVVDRDYKIKDGNLSVEFQRIESGGPTEASWSSEPTFIVELLDDDGNLISSSSTNVVYTKDQLESVFSLGVEESSSITFDFDTTKGIAKFKVSSRWNENKETIQGSFDLGGAVSKYPVTMHLDIKGGQVEGSYYYNKRGPNARLQLSGTYKDGKMNLNESDEKGVPTGHFKGEFEDGEYKGKFIDSKGNSLNFLLTEAGASVDEVLAAFDEGEVPDDYDSLPDDYDSFPDDDDEGNDESIFNNKGDQSIDKFLDEYAEFMDEYITCIKKMGNGDPTALLNYGKMLSKYYSLAEKGDKMKGNMSPKQLEKLGNISMKILSAMQSVEE